MSRAVCRKGLACSTASTANSSTPACRSATCSLRSPERTKASVHEPSQLLKGESGGDVSNVRTICARVNKRVHEMQG